MMITGIVLNNRKYLPTNMDDVLPVLRFLCVRRKTKDNKDLLVWPIFLHRGINGFFTRLWPQSNEGKDTFFNFTLQ